MAFRTAVRLDDLWSGEMTSTWIGGTRVLVVRIDDEVYAFEDRCAHQAVPMSEGTLEGTTLTCSAHHYQYDARTGKGINPTNLALRRFPLQIVDGYVQVDVGAPRVD